MSETIIELDQSREAIEGSPYLTLPGAELPAFIEKLNPDEAIALTLASGFSERDLRYMTQHFWPYKLDRLDCVIIPAQILKIIGAKSRVVEVHMPAKPNRPDYTLSGDNFRFRGVRQKAWVSVWMIPAESSFRVKSDVI